MQEMVNTLKSLRQSCKALSEEERRSVSLSETPVCNSVLDQMSWMQKPEEEKLRLCQEFPLPKNVSIDENQEVNRLFFSLLVLLVEDNILYEKFLQWLLDVDNYELFIRIKKFVSSINSILPSSDPYYREEQYSLNRRMRARTMKIAQDIRVFVNEALSGIELSDDQKQLYPRYLRKLIMVMCYNQVSRFY